MARRTSHLERAARSRVLRWCAASLLLVWLTLPYWRQQIDDVFITLAFAWEWIEHGRIQWNTGQVVEGYSNFLLLVLLAGVAALGGDPGIWAKWLSLGSSLALLAVATTVLTPGRLGALVLIAIATWAPFDYWAAMGMETPLFALLLTAGWYLVLQDGRRWAAGMWVLWLASLTRPEGVAFLLAGSLAWFRQRPPRARITVLAATSLLALVAYHAWRLAYFGSLVSPPALIKIGNEGFGWRGAAQLGRELPAMLGLGVLMAMHRPARRDLPWLVLPLLVCAGLLLRANGDWMGWSRLVLPGAVATTVCWCARGTPRAVGLHAVAALGALLAAVAVIEPAGQELHLRSVWSIRERTEALGRGVETPLERDVAWVVQNVPQGGMVLASDVGMMGNVPGVAVLDTDGLTDRDVAEWHAQGDRPNGADGLRRRLTDPGSRPFAVRGVDWTGGLATPAFPGLTRLLPSSLEVLYPYAERFRAGQGNVIWRKSDRRKPSADLVVSRWTELRRRYPSQPFFTTRLAEALWRAGRKGDAADVLRERARRWPHLE